MSNDTELLPKVVACMGLIQHWTGKVETSLNAGVVDNGGIDLCTVFIILV